MLVTFGISSVSIAPMLPMKSVRVFNAFCKNQALFCNTCFVYVFKKPT